MSAEFGMRSAEYCTTCLCFRAVSSAGLVVLLLIAARNPPSPAELIRQGNAAFERGEVAIAEALYTQAEERTGDPGLVAFNKADALYQQEKYRDAEVHFRRALGDAAISPERRRHALYNLGNSLLKQAGESDVAGLRSAIRCYEMCLDEAPASETAFRSDSSYNLELAKLLWAKARAKSPNQQKSVNDEEPQDDLRQPPELKKEPKNDNNGATAEPKKGESPRKIDDAGKEGAKKGEPTETKEKTTPGRSAMPVLKDEDQATPLSADDTRAYLRLAAERLRKERLETRRQAANPLNPRLNDW